PAAGRTSCRRSSGAVRLLRPSSDLRDGRSRTGLQRRALHARGRARASRRRAGHLTAGTADVVRLLVDVGVGFALGVATVLVVVARDRRNAARPAAAHTAASFVSTASTASTAAPA